MIFRLLSKLFNYRDIVGKEGLYLRRFFLTPRWLPKRIFLHYFVRGDKDRFLHDHPWDFITLCLAGGYEETWRPDLGSVYAPRRRLMPGQWRSVRAEHTHKVTLLKSPTWTLLVVGRARRQWGFHTNAGWVNWREYLGLPSDTPDSPEDI